VTEAAFVQSVPTLAFSIASAEAVRYAAAPTVAFSLRIESDAEVRSTMLQAQIRIAAPERPYDAAEQERLRDLFGPPEDWGRTLRSVLWTHATVLVAPFSGTTTVELPVACTYDFEIAAAKYFHALEVGEVPLEFLFSGTLFYTGAHGDLQTARISWENEARFRLPVAVWQEAVERAFPGSAWLRVHRELFGRLAAYRARRTLPTWDAVLEELLEGRE
jgi:hypothetical protein